MSVAGRSSEELVGDAEAAAAAGDLTRADGLWAESRARFPDQFRGFVSGGATLRQLGRLPEAVEVLSAGLARFPDEEWLANEHAWTLYDAGDFARAAAAWAAVRQRFPLDPDGYLGGGVTCRSAADFDAADAIYRQAFERLPDHEQLHVHFAWCARERADLIEATARWESVLTKFPDLPDGHIHRGICLLERGHYDAADAALSAALTRFPFSADAFVAHAWVAQNRGDWPEALHRWETALTKFPQLREPRRFAAQALMEMGRAAEAATVLAPALRLYPDDPDLCVLDGWVSTRGRDGVAAERVWRAVRERFPERVDGYHGWAVALRDQGRLDEADAMVTEAHGRFPDNPVIAMEFAAMPERLNQWSLAIHRWHGVIGRLPEHAGGYLGLSNSLRRARHVADATAVLQVCRELFPNDLEVATAAAAAASRDADWPEALRLWAEAMACFPDQPAALFGYARALRASGLLDQAAALLTDATRRFPNQADLAVEFALTLSQQRRWTEALPLWAILKQRFPSEGLVQAGITASLGQAQADQHVHGAAGFEIPDILLQPGSGGPPYAERRARLLKRFESLGDSCEFGIVQRLYGVEQVSLLRWARTTPDNLVTALNARLEGVGDPEHTIVHVSGDEYTTEDRRYFMHSHTFTSPLAEPSELFAPEQCRRLQWLRRRLLESLSTAAKIFIYKSDDGITDAQVMALQAALQQYSTRSAFLCVRLATPERPSGSLDHVRDGLFLGYIDRFSTVDVNVNAWLALCEAVADALAQNLPQAEAG